MNPRDELVEQGEALGEADRSVASRRMTVNLRPSDVERLQKIVRSTDLKPNEVIRRSLALEEFVSEVMSDGRKIWIEDDDGELRLLEILR